MMPRLLSLIPHLHAHLVGHILAIPALTHLKVNYWFPHIFPLFYQSSKSSSTQKTAISSFKLLRPQNWAFTLYSSLCHFPCIMHLIASLLILWNTYRIWWLLSTSSVTNCWARLHQFSLVCYQMSFTWFPVLTLVFSNQFSIEIALWYF